MNSLCLNFIFSFFIGLSTCQALDTPAPFSLSPDQDILYKTAFQHRNEGRPAEAARLFRELAVAGHPNSMYNYAHLHHNADHKQVAYQWFKKAADLGFEPAKKSMRNTAVKDLFLVVGSIRESGSMHKILDHIRQKPGVDCSHTKTYEGQATTMDLESSLIPANHIQGDVRIFDFSPYLIQAAYLERLPTLSEQGVQDFSLAGNNFIGECIKPISRSMSEGAVLEIELDPYVSLTTAHPMVKEYARKNPFHAFADINLFFNGVLAATGADLSRIEGLILQDILSLKEKVNHLLRLWVTDDVPFSLKDLHERLNQEIMILREIMVGQKIAFLQAGPKSCLPDFSKAFEKRVMLSQPNNPLPQSMVQLNGVVGKFYDGSKFLQDTVLNFLIANLMVDINRTYIQSYLESIGFVDVSIDLTTSPHNGRTNVWIIKAVKGVVGL